MDEDDYESFAIIGPDVPDDLSCFQLVIGDTECIGRVSATGILIVDEDGEFISYLPYSAT